MMAACDEAPAASAEVACDHPPLLRRPSAPRRRSKVDIQAGDKVKPPHLLIRGSQDVHDRSCMPVLSLPAETGVQVRFVSNRRISDEHTGRPFTEYNAEIRTPLTSWTCSCRYKELSDVHRSLQQTLGSAAPSFPRKPGLFGANLQSDFVQQRQDELNDWIGKVFLIPACLTDKTLIALFESERGDLAIHISICCGRAATAALQQALRQSEEQNAKLQAQMDAVNTALFQFRLRLARLESGAGVAHGQDVAAVMSAASCSDSTTAAKNVTATSEGSVLGARAQRSSQFKSFSTAIKSSVAVDESGEESEQLHQRSFTFPAPFRATDLRVSYNEDDPLQGCPPSVARLLGGPDSRPPARSVKGLNLPGPADAVDFSFFASTLQDNAFSGLDQTTHQIVLNSPTGVHVNMGARATQTIRPSSSDVHSKSSSPIEWLNSCIESLIKGLTPSRQLQHDRINACQFVQKLLQRGLGLEAVCIGSTAAGSELVDSDVDLTLLCGPAVDSNAAMDALNAVLCAVARGCPMGLAVQQLRAWPIDQHPSAAPEKQANSDVLTHDGLPKWASAVAGTKASHRGTNEGTYRPVFGPSPWSNAETHVESLPRISKVSFVAAAVPLVKVVASRVSVDVSVNAIHSVAAALLTRLANEWIGENDLFIRSLRFLRAVLKYQVPFIFQSATTSPMSAELGTLNSWSVTIMLLALFNSHPIPIRSPFSALLLFLEEYHKFPFGTHVITLHGPLHLFNLTRSRPTVQPRYVTDARLHPLRQLAARSEIPDKAPTFHISTANIQDPVAPFQNTATAVTRDGSALIHRSLTKLRSSAQALAEHLLSDSFSSTVASEATLNVIGGLFNKCAGDLHKIDGRAASETWQTFIESGKFSGEDQQAEAPPLMPLNSVLRDAQFGFLVSKQAPVAQTLLDVAAGILHFCGQMSVGQLGRILQDACMGAISAAQIKAGYGGLKQLLMTRPDTFLLHQDHPFNPTCSLQPTSADDQQLLTSSAVEGDASQTRGE